MDKQKEKEKNRAVDESVTPITADRKPTAMDMVREAIQNAQNVGAEFAQNAMADGTVVGGGDATNNIPMKRVIDEQVVNDATLILMRYMNDKHALQARIVENEKWYRLRHWDVIHNGEAQKNPNAIKPTSAWLFNCIANKHADAMDNYPSPNILPREVTDKPEAKTLSSILPVILDQNDFEETYSEVWDYKLKNGTGVYGVFWDSTKLNGLGDIAIKKIDLLNLYWESGITDIQKSRNIFHTELMDNDLLVSKYPQLANKLGGNTILTAEKLYANDDNIDTTNKSVVTDWYYKKVAPSGKTVVHYVKFCGSEVLYATENDTVSQIEGEEPMSERGLYDHGEYPFVFDSLFSVEGSPVGFGYIDIGKNPQGFIDEGNQAILKNLLVNARPRYFIRSDGSVNEGEYADLTKDFVHVNGNLGEDSIRPVQGNALNDIYVTILNNKVEELKETTGNRDIQTGGTTGGITAASAIAAMQEAGGKLSRDHIKASYRAFRKVCNLMIELIRQFYDLPRYFRIVGEGSEEAFITYTNSHIKPQAQGTDFGVDMGMRLPLFDIEITAQKSSPYSKMAQNELALQFLNAGFFNPMNATASLACLEMMDFDRKEFVMQRIAQNGEMYQQMMMMAQMQNAAQNGGSAKETEALGGESGAGESSVTREARQRTADSTSPT